VAAEGGLGLCHACDRRATPTPSRAEWPAGQDGDRRISATCHLVPRSLTATRVTAPRIVWSAAAPPNGWSDTWLRLTCPATSVKTYDRAGHSFFSRYDGYRGWLPGFRRRSRSATTKRPPRMAGGGCWRSLTSTSSRSADSGKVQPHVVQRQAHAGRDGDGEPLVSLLRGAGEMCRQNRGRTNRPTSCGYVDRSSSQHRIDVKPAVRNRGTISCMLANTHGESPTRKSPGAGARIRLRLRNRGSTRAVDGEPAAQPGDAAVPPRPKDRRLGRRGAALGGRRCPTHTSARRRCRRRRRRRVLLLPTPNPSARRHAPAPTARCSFTKTERSDRQGSGQLRLLSLSKSSVVWAVCDRPNQRSDCPGGDKEQPGAIAPSYPRAKQALVAELAACPVAGNRRR
jgi:hypothetical protein